MTNLRMLRPARRVAPALLGALVLLVGIATPAYGVSRANAEPAVTRDYLALGDSVTFGYRESNTSPPPNYSDPSTFVGYPEDVGKALGIAVANAACPGETSLSLIERDVQSNGCENSPGGGPGYRTAFPLHVRYKGTQLQYALNYLAAHPHTQLVTLMIGANDAFLCEETTSDGCTSELPAVLKQITMDVRDILGAVRSQAHYHRQIVMVNYYSLDYANPLDTAESQLLNKAMDRGAKGFDTQIANGFTAFHAAAAQSGGNTCTAGLLTQLTSGGCGIHPSAAGQAVLALAVEEAVQRG